jgi:response regulator of citrate/malate metabolism
MKKATLILLCCVLANTTLLFSQYKDSTALAKEMERVNRMYDSMQPILKARDSINQAKLEELFQNAKKEIEENKQKELEDATKEVVQRQQKEQQSKRNTMLLAGTVFLITVIVARIFFKRKKQDR